MELVKQKLCKALQFDCFAFGLAKEVVKGNERFATLDQC